jgi:hypothetical protein
MHHQTLYVTAVITGTLHIKVLTPRNSAVVQVARATGENYILNWPISCFMSTAEMEPTISLYRHLSNVVPNTWKYCTLFTWLHQTLRIENGLSVAKLVTNEAVLSDTSWGDGNKGRPQDRDSKSKQFPLLARYTKFRVGQFSNPLLWEFPQIM